MEVPMKLFKFIILSLAAVLLTGCYTQLKHTATSPSAENTYQEGEEEEYIPLDYKDYEYSERYEACNCNPYKSYSSYYFAPSWNYHSFYDSYWGRTHYRPYLSPHYWALSPYMRWRMSVGFGYHHSFYNNFGFSFSWGSPFFHSFYGNSFYYDPYWYGYYHRPFAYNYNNFYGSGYYRNVYRNNDQDYRRRSIGTGRVSSDRVRSRSSSDRSTVRSRSSDTSTSTPSVRRRSTGSSRTNNGSVGRSRSRSDNSSTGSVGRSRSSSGNSSSSGSRSRSRDNNNLQSSIDSRSGETPNRVSPVGIVPERGAAKAVRSRSENSDRIRRQLQSADRKKTNSGSSRGGIFNRLRKAFDTGKVNILKSSSRSSSRTRVRSTSPTRKSKPSVTRSSTRSKSRSTVRQSRSSSSSKSSSRGRSSRSRSRGN